MKASPDRVASIFMAICAVLFLTCPPVAVFCGWVAYLAHQEATYLERCARERGANTEDWTMKALNAVTALDNGAPPDPSIGTPRLDDE